MKTKEQAIAYITKQFKGTEGTFTIVPKSKRKEARKTCWHYGRVEISNLLDFIYQKEKK